MIDFLRDFITVMLWFFFDFVPSILLMPLGPLGELKGLLSEIKWLIGLIPIAVTGAIAFYKKYIQ